MRINLLKFVYNGILTGMPLFTYNPISKNTLNVPLEVKPFSAYLNFKLNDNQSEYLNNYISKFSNSLELVPINIFPNEEKSNYLSLNIYNCTSPVFFNDEKEITRLELNTYVKDKNGKYGTLIIDYLCSDLSMDPINIFKTKEQTIYKDIDIYKSIDCFSIKDNINLKLNFTTLYDYNQKISDNLIKFTDYIFYKNGIYDKIYYDSSLVEANTKSPSISYNLTFIYNDLIFEKVDSIFYFTNPIKFIGGMWDNLFD
tara:strand:+ start:187 stop:954 length:768 start_codon:yes stop_codon:yes gene_type:complete